MANAMSPNIKLENCVKNENNGGFIAPAPKKRRSNNVANNFPAAILQQLKFIKQEILPSSNEKTTPTLDYEQVRRSFNYFKKNCHLVTFKMKFSKHANL